MIRSDRIEHGWALVTAAVYLLTDAHKLIGADCTSGTNALETAMEAALRAKAHLGRLTPDKP